MGGTVRRLVLGTGWPRHNKQGMQRERRDGLGVSGAAQSSAFPAAHPAQTITQNGRWSVSILRGGPGLQPAQGPSARRRAGAAGRRAPVCAACCQRAAAQQHRSLPGCSVWVARVAGAVQ